MSVASAALQSTVQPGAVYQQPLPTEQHLHGAGHNPVADIAGLFGSGNESTDPFTLYGTVR